VQSNIYSYSTIDSQEFLRYNLSAVLGDSIYSRDYDDFWNTDGKIILTGDYDFTSFLDKIGSQKRYSLPNSFYIQELATMEGFGLIKEHASFDFGESDKILQGAVIDGVVYGDTTVTALEDVNRNPQKFSLLQNYPNPFNPSTIIKYELRIRSEVSLSIFGVTGRKIDF